MIKTNVVFIFLVLSLSGCIFYIITHQNSQQEGKIELSPIAIDSINQIHNDYKILIQKKEAELKHLDLEYIKTISEKDSLQNEFKNYQSKALKQINKLKSQLKECQSK